MRDWDIVFYIRNWHIVTACTSIKKNLCVDVNGVLLIEMGLLGSNQDDFFRI